MCGIVGVFAFNKYGLFEHDINIFHDLFCVSVLRGFDGSGVFYVGDEETGIGVSKKKMIHGSYVNYLKHAVTPSELLMSKEYDGILAKIRKSRYLVGHARAATVGKVSTEAAQPFLKDHIVLVHNGTLKFIDGMPIYKYKSDSEALCHAVAKESPEKALNKVEGAVAIVWHDALKGTINLYRNEERPLYYAKKDDRVVVASEKEMLNLVLGRRSSVADKYEINPVEVNKIMSFSVDGVLKEIDAKTKKAYQFGDDDWSHGPYGNYRGRRNWDGNWESRQTTLYAKRYSGVSIGDNLIIAPIELKYWNKENQQMSGGDIKCEFVGNISNAISGMSGMSEEDISNIHKCEITLHCYNHKSLTEMYSEEYLSVTVSSIKMEGVRTLITVKEPLPVSKKDVDKVIPEVVEKNSEEQKVLPYLN